MKGQTRETDIFQPIFDELIFPSLSVGRVHFHFRGVRSDF